METILSINDITWTAVNEKHIAPFSRAIGVVFTFVLAVVVGALMRILLRKDIQNDFRDQDEYVEVPFLPVARTPSPVLFRSL